MTQEEMLGCIGSPSLEDRYAVGLSRARPNRSIRYAEEQQLLVSGYEMFQEEVGVVDYVAHSDYNFQKV